MNGPKRMAALVTGASRGIGKAIAIELAKAGYAVGVNYHNSSEAAHGVKATIIGMGAQAVTVQGNVADEENACRIVDEMMEIFGSIDLLVNNAGSIQQPSNWLDLDSTSWRSTLDLNLGAAVWLSRAAASHMKEKGGSIINIGSVYGDIGATPVLAYTAAKAGIVNITRALAKELAPKIRVNCISPGNIDTDMTQAAGQDLIDQVVKSTPLRRLGTTDEIAVVVRFLATEGTFFTGANIIVDGGFSLR